MPRYMRMRPVLHEAEAKTYEAEATKFGLKKWNWNFLVCTSFIIMFKRCI